MIEIGNCLELHVCRNSGPYFDMQAQKSIAVLKIYHDGSVVVWSSEPQFELKRSSIRMLENENAWDTIVRAIQQARRGR